MPSDAERIAVLHRTLEAALDIKKHNRLQQFVPYAKQQEFFELGATKQERMLNAGNQLGKALENNTLVATPNGWLPIGQLSIGDEVIAGDGTPTKITAVWPQGEVDLFAMLFDGKNEILACGEHRWTCKPPADRWTGRPWSVHRTTDLMRFCTSPKQRPIVPPTPEFDLPDRELSLDPYLLGALLGDGSFKSGSVTFTSNDPELVDYLRDHAAITEHNRPMSFGVLAMQRPVKRLGLWGTGSGDKFIPKEYLYAGRSARLAILHGLMDTDGSISEDGAAEYTTISPQLAEDMRWLAISLGLRVSVKWRQTYDQNGRGKPSARIRFLAGDVCPFRLSRKAKRWIPRSLTNCPTIWSIEPAGRGEATCIAVAHPSHTYVIEHGIVTHNSDAGAFETACHVTGIYPSWWTGLRFDEPILAWACGLTADKTMGINQLKLCGKPNTPDTLGTGLIPRSCFTTDPVLGRGTTGAFASVAVKHVSGGYSTLAFKSYEQGWQKLQGDSVRFIWLDEEPDDLKIYTECKARLLATGGSMMITFTPLLGETELYQLFSRADDDNKGFVNMTGDDVLSEPHGHLTQEKYDGDIASFPAHEREARRSGRPIMGSGSIFEISRETIEIPPITEPLGHWRMGWGIDFGGMGGASRKFSHPFAAVLGFYDPITDIIYIAHALQLKNMMPIQHADAMKRICAGAPVFWPHDGHRRTSDDSPETTSGLYRGLGLRMFANHATFATGGYATETGIMEMTQRFTSGRLKVCSHLRDWWDEFISYHRDEKGDIVKVHDDLMSATRMLVMMAKRFCVGGIPMGNMGGQHWKDFARRNSETEMARGVDDWDIWTGQ